MGVGLVGYYGYGNYGDDIFLEVWKKKLGDTATVILPETNLEIVDKIVIGGGDLIWHGAFNNNYFNEKWYEDGRKVYVYGVGVASPAITIFEDPNVFQLYKNFLSRAEYVSARDELSAEWLTSVLGIKNVKWVEDIAWNYVPEISIPKKNRTVGITYRKNQLYNGEDIVKVALKLLDTEKRIQLIPLQNSYYNTYNLHRMIFDEITKDTVYPMLNIDPCHYNTQHKYASIVSCSHYITHAFHGLITALKERIPVLSFVHSNKFKTVLKRCHMSKILVNKAALYPNIDFLMSNQYKFADEDINKIELKGKEDLSNFINSVLLK